MIGSRLNHPEMALWAKLAPWGSGDWGRRLAYLGAIAALSLGLPTHSAVAQTPALPTVISETSGASDQAVATAYYEFLRDFPSGNALDDQIDYIGDSATISETRLTLPSLWWNKEQIPSRFGGYRLVREWRAYQVKDSPLRVVDLNVNSQIWRVLNYYERYAVLNTFGAAAQSFGYNLRLFNGSGFAAQMIGVYACDFAANDFSSSVAIANLADGWRTSACQGSLDLQRLVGIGSND